jgi:hypothetical protein
MRFPVSIAWNSKSPEVQESRPKVQQSAEPQEARRAWKSKSQESVELKESRRVRNSNRVAQESGRAWTSKRPGERGGPRGQESVEVEAQESVEAHEYRRAQESVEL